MTSNPYESDRILAEYLCFHYPPGEAEGLPLPGEAMDFARRVVEELIDSSAPATRALDIGCAVGRSAFELARHSAEVIGIDFSQAFIAAANELKMRGEKAYRVAVEGDQCRAFVATVPAEIERGRVGFETGDAMELRADLGAFDIVLAANLVCRLPEPLRFFDRVASLVVPGGQLLLATPFSWLREYTPEEKWLGGRVDGPTGWDAVQQLLHPHFELEFSTNIPFLIREHSRKYQYGISLGSRWRRR